MCCVMSCSHIQQDLQVGVRHSRLYNRERERKREELRKTEDHGEGMKIIEKRMNLQNERERNEANGDDMK